MEKRIDISPFVEIVYNFWMQKSSWPEDFPTFLV